MELLGKTKRWGWSKRLWGGPQVIATRNERTYAVKDMNDSPVGITKLGCSGFDGKVYRWGGLDLDVKHGSDPYESDEEALKAAKRACDAVLHPAIVTTSSNCGGYHVFIHFDGAGMTKAELRLYFETLSVTADFKADKGPLGAQRFFLFNRSNPGANRHVYGNAASVRVFLS